MAIESKFLRLADEMMVMETSMLEATHSQNSVYVLRIQQEELKATWDGIKAEYHRIMDLPEVENKDSLAKLYQDCLNSYISTSSSLSEVAENRTHAAQFSSTGDHSRSQSPQLGFATQLPPCDIEPFHGDFHSWPTFRDLFTAIYLQNTRLSPVQRLFYLLQKCKGEARALVQKCPLTNDGFSLAWKRLKDTYENKRVLIHTQLSTLFNLQKLKTESAPDVKFLHNEINNIIASLNLYEVDITNWDTIFVHVCVTRLPETTLTLWEQSIGDVVEIPAWSRLDAFLTSRIRSLETLCQIVAVPDRSAVPHSTPRTFSRSQPPQNTRHNRLNNYHLNISSPKCSLCNSRQHMLRGCAQFLKASVKERYSILKELRLCFNCFAQSHMVSECKSRFTCSKCRSKHHTLLHENAPPKPQAIELPEDDVPSTSAAASRQVSTHFATSRTNVLLGTAEVSVVHEGLPYRVRALIDSGSEASFISTRLQKLLKLPMSPVSAQVSGLNCTKSGQVTRMCNIALTAPKNPEFRCKANCLILPNLTGNLPSRTISNKSACSLPKEQLADEHWMETGPIDLLIGADLYPEILLEGLKKNVLDSLLAQQTVFGWILTGPLADGSTKPKTIVSFFNEVSLDQQLTKFWEQEEVSSPKPLTLEEKFCEDLYKQTTNRNTDGRYIVALPFRPDAKAEVLQNSKEIARCVFLRNEKSLLKKPMLKAEYDAVLKEYSQLGHMQKVNEVVEYDFFLPHHAVIKPESTTTKVRVVFNASSKSRNGASLNDLLYPGPTLQADLMQLLLRWRLFKYVFNGDIEKMYRQILVRPSDSPFQKILFRESPQDNLNEYELKTVTFGVNCAPYLAIRTLHQLAKDVIDDFPLAANILTTMLYVDDALVGAHDLHSAIRSRDELRAALKTAGFVMRKWTANNPALLKGIDPNDLLREDFLKIEDASSAKTLGMRWNAVQDRFFFKANDLDIQKSYSKREVLSTIARLFDPAGWLAPIVIKAKILMQKIWLRKTGWDENISNDLLVEWQTFLQDYEAINEIGIPRWVNYSPEVNIQFHAFSDASEQAYGACLYLRVAVGHTIISNLICAKSRVAPIKTISLPRLELCGAHLLAEMVASLKEIEIDHSKLFCWTDSTIVLAWLNKPPCAWKVFVANRVTKIHEKLGAASWNHVESSSNPADLVSRGISAPQLVKNSLWWNGPNWLCREQDSWPKGPKLEDCITENEQRKIKVNFVIEASKESIMDRFSSLDRGIRVVAYVLRFVRGCKKQKQEKNIAVLGDEFAQTKQFLIILTQKQYFGTEYETLGKSCALSSKSSLLSLNPFMDDQKCMRVGGRLSQASSLTYGERHPILLPYGATFSRLLCADTHLKTNHGGNQLVLRVLRSQFWIIKVKNLVRCIVRKCKVCVIHRRKTNEQLMGSLPADRLTLTKPFAVSGVDFCGPFDIKTYAGRGCRVTKGYVCVFVCFATKAIHLEVTSDLSTPTFLEAFSRFVARRGCPRKIVSDNGTNFVGASREIKREFEKFIRSSHDAIESRYASQVLQWSFIPPGAPHMGGLWEAGVKSFKSHFKKVIGDRKLTFEEFSTLLTRIESCLNSRPLSPQSVDPDDLVPLTPGHFLIGGPLVDLCETAVSLGNISLSNRWQKLKALYQEICRRWKNEYLSELQKRRKWTSSHDNLKVGDLVVIKEENLPPNEWRMGRIITVHPGKDEMVRVVSMRTSTGVVKRPITKLVQLHPENE